jgi:hypothetical protein
VGHKDRISKQGYEKFCLCVTISCPRKGDVDGETWGKCTSHPWWRAGENPLPVHVVTSDKVETLGPAVLSSYGEHNYVSVYFLLFTQSVQWLGYKLVDRGIWVRYPREVRDFPRMSPTQPPAQRVNVKGRPRGGPNKNTAQKSSLMFRAYLLLRNRVYRTAA